MRIGEIVTARLPLLSILTLLAVAGCERAKTPDVPLRGDRFDPVRRLIAETTEKYKIASVAIAAAKDGEIVWEEAFGWADRAEHVPATPHSIYALASISKSFTATGIMVLAERGLVDLDRPVNEYLDGTKLTVHAGEPEQVTVRRVLQFTAGLPMHHNLFFENESARPPGQDESIRRYGIVVEEPGREYVYSNFGYGVLDRVISGVSGMSYPEFMRTEVFAPLGLTHTSVLADSALEGHVVRHYDAEGNIVPRLDFDHRGASAVHASVHDLIRYGMFHLGNELPGGAPILGESTIGMMQRPSDVAMTHEGPGEARMGLGCAVVDLAGVRFVSMTGGMPGTVTRLALIPAENAAVAVLINCGVSEIYTPWDIEWDTFAALIPGFPERPEITGPQQEDAPVPEELHGVWRGTIATYQGDVPAALSISGARNMALEIDGMERGPIRVRTPLGGVTFRRGALEGPFLGSIPTDDCARARHVIYLRLRRRGDMLSGVAAAVAVDRTFWLPHWMELRRAPEGE